MYSTLGCTLSMILVKGLSVIPSMEKNKACMPRSFAKFSNCRIVLDCTEIPVANVQDNMETQKQTYSNLLLF